MSGVGAFFAGKCVFLTGGTGFLGHVVAEKLLRSCPGIEKLFLLVRPKGGARSEDRIREMLKDQFFDRVRREVPGFESKLIGVSGDCSQPGLGLNFEDELMLQREVNIIIHSAASINMKESLKRSVKTNFVGTQEVVKLAKRLDQLKAFVYVSTAFSPCENHHIEERVYNPPITPQGLESLYQNLKEDTLELLSPSIKKGKPNNYVAVKAVTEEYVRQELEGRPACIFRPSVISATRSEPMPGWMLSWFSVCGILVQVYRGAVSTLCLDLTKSQSLIPCDMTANAVICAAYKAGTSGPSGDMTVYNFVTSADNLVTSRRIYDYNRKYFEAYPTVKALGYPSYVVSSDYRKFKILHTVRDLIPAFFRDLPNVLMFRTKRNLRRVIFLEYFMDSLRYFMVNDWRFDDANVVQLWESLNDEDKSIFPFDMKTVEWDDYMKDFVLGARQYLLKDPLETLEKAKRLQKKFYYRKVLVRIILAALTVKAIWIYVQVTTVLAAEKEDM